MSQRRPYLSVLKPGSGLDPIGCVEAMPVMALEER